MANTLENCTHSGAESLIETYHLIEPGKALLRCKACGAVRKIVVASPESLREPWRVPLLLAQHRATLP
jgi:hypothetical protein